ncbi:MAG: helix-turn-helix domain-containing protein [Treponema sp.]|jgi:AraC-like DNA-binding protein/ligand-binding sensor protein|nr:helix-turn-helix domain-containing protein [Treponema sp.]
MSIISRREIEPLLLKAREVLKFYETATETAVAVLDSAGHPVGNSIDETYSSGVFRFCAFCKKHQSALGNPSGEDEHPCTQMHINGIREARQSGGIYIYLCDMGFLFWASPLITAGHLAGALIAGGVLGIDRQQAADWIREPDGAELTREEREFLLNAKEKKVDEIKSLAQTLLLCAEHISHNTEDYRETLKRLGEQEESFSTQIRLFRGDNDIPPPSYALDRERTFLAALRRGDNDAGRKILGELLENILVASHHNFESMKLRAIELVVILSREAVTPDKSEDSIILETNNRYIKRIQESKNTEELTDILYLIVDRMAGRIFSFQGIRHASALRKAERYIWENYTRKICLKEIAEASGLSAPYFSSIFKEEMGENLSTYLNRLRVERAATMLIESDMSLNKIAEACGFEDQSWFSKIFKSYTGKSPGKYREQGEGTFFTAWESSENEEIG